MVFLPYISYFIQNTHAPQKNHNLYTLGCLILSLTYVHHYFFTLNKLTMPPTCLSPPHQTKYNTPTTSPSHNLYYPHNTSYNKEIAFPLYMSTTFGSIDYARLLAVMKDLGYPTDAVEIIGNIYKNSTTAFTGNHFGTTLQSTLVEAPSRATP